MREASLADIPEIDEVLNAGFLYEHQNVITNTNALCFQKGYWTKNVHQWILNDFFHVIVAYSRQDKSIIGCIIYGRSEDAKLSLWGQIKAIYVLPEYMGSGVGSALLETALQSLIEKGYEYVYLWMLQENRQAGEFYESAGFHRTQEYCRVIVAGRHLTDVRYIKTLFLADDEER